jgi:hypothetical protein
MNSPSIGTGPSADFQFILPQARLHEKRLLCPVIRTAGQRPGYRRIEREVYFHIFYLYEFLHNLTIE